MQKSLDLSLKIQLALAPSSLPTVSGLSIHSYFKPCGTVAGDMYDVIKISDETIAFYIFDVSGHGVSSALISAVAKATFNKYMWRFQTPSSIIVQVNDEIMNKLAGENFFITAFVALFDLRSNKLTYANAGHPNPILYKESSGTIKNLETTGLFMGYKKTPIIEDKNEYLNPGDIFTIFTDGLYQLYNKENHLEARKSLENSILNGIYTSGEIFVNYVRSHHENSIPAPDDDITSIYVKVLSQSLRDKTLINLGFNTTDPVFLQELSYYEEIDSISSQILKDMDDAGFSDDVIRKMKLTVTELIANGIGHGNKDDHNKKVIVGHKFENETMTISILDEGNGFDPDKVPDPTLPENLVKDHGRGIFIVRNYVDKMEYNEKGNRVLISKKR